METYDIICFGAGPTGLATAIEARRAEMRSLVIDKGKVVHRQDTTGLASNADIRRRYLAM